MQGSGQSGVVYVNNKRWTSASRLDRGESCPASTVLPETRTEPGKSAIWGSGAHKYVEHGVVPEGKDWPAWVTKGLIDKIKCSGFKREDYYPAPGVHEAHAILWGDNLEHASLVFDHGVDGLSPFPAIPGSIRFKIDYIGERDDTAWVDDLKTGRFAPPATSLQIAAAALVVAQMQLRDAVWGSVTHWPRYPKQALPTREWHLYDAEELDIVKNRLLLLRDIACGPNPPAVPSEEACRWCPCKPDCEAGQEFDRYLETKGI